MTDSLDSTDWRSAKTFLVSAIGDKQQIPPVVGRQVSLHQGVKAFVSFTTPSASALHLNRGFKCAEEAVEHWGEIKWRNSSNIQSFGLGTIQRQVHEDSDVALFDFFEAAMTSAMCSYAAIEAYCNFVVLTRMKGPMTVKSKKKDGPLSVEDVERNVSTSDKLKSIVPKLLDVPNPAGQRIWEKFVVLERVRNSVTHFKLRDESRNEHRQGERLTDPTVLHLLLEQDVRALPRAALEMLKYLTASDPPRWINNPTWN